MTTRQLIKCETHHDAETGQDVVVSTYLDSFTVRGICGLDEVIHLQRQETRIVPHAPAVRRPRIRGVSW